MHTVPGKDEASIDSLQALLARHADVLADTAAARREIHSSRVKIVFLSDDRSLNAIR
ncbi:MAG: hypothetical protein ABIP08_01695 [Lautropia sp.]